MRHSTHVLPPLHRVGTWSMVASTQLRPEERCEWGPAWHNRPSRATHPSLGMTHKLHAQCPVCTRPQRFSRGSQSQEILGNTTDPDSLIGADIATKFTYLLSARSDCSYHSDANKFWDNALDSRIVRIGNAPPQRHSGRITSSIKVLDKERWILQGAIDTIRHRCDSEEKAPRNIIHTLREHHAREEQAIESSIATINYHHNALIPWRASLLKFCPGSLCSMRSWIMATMIERSRSVPLSLIIDDGADLDSRKMSLVAKNLHRVKFFDVYIQDSKTRPFLGILNRPVSYCGIETYAFPSTFLSGNTPNLRHMKLTTHSYVPWNCGLFENLATLEVRGAKRTSGPNAPEMCFCAGKDHSDSRGENTTLELTCGLSSRTLEDSEYAKIKLTFSWHSDRCRGISPLDLTWTSFEALASHQFNSFRVSGSDIGWDVDVWQKFATMCGALQGTSPTRGENVALADCCLPALSYLELGVFCHYPMPTADGGKAPLTEVLAQSLSMRATIGCSTSELAFIPSWEDSPEGWSDPFGAVPGIIVGEKASWARETMVSNTSPIYYSMSTQEARCQILTASDLA
ncbi:hypothetical protein BD779DRAFT_1483332 [Infundibulicybe gibba]|nr:hypothetical protein BD779DRAFT_1483332 [Infundibulicybe gibba]